MKKGTEISLFLVVIILLGISIFFNYKMYELISNNTTIFHEESENDSKTFEKSIQLLKDGDILNANNYFINFINKEKNKFQYLDSYSKEYVQTLKDIPDVSLKTTYLNDYISFLYNQYLTIKSENIDNLTDLISELENTLIGYYNEVEEDMFQDNETISNNEITAYITNILKKPVNNFQEYQENKNSIYNYLYEDFSDQEVLDKVNTWEEKWDNYFLILDLTEQGKKYLDACDNKKDNNEIYLAKANEIKMTLISYLPLLKAGESESNKIINDFINFYDNFLLKKEEQIYNALKARNDEIIASKDKYYAKINNLNNLKIDLNNKYASLDSETYKVKFEELNKEITYEIQSLQKTLYNAYQRYALQNFEDYFNYSKSLTLNSEESRKLLELCLGDLDTTLLNQDVMMIYNEIYSKIYSKLNAEEKISASLYLLDSKKKALEDF